jgi:glucose-6-phosphate isomerase
MDLNLCGSYLVYNIYPKWIEPYELYTENHYKNYYTYSLSLNPNSIKYLEKYPDKINWHSLSKNENSIEFLKPEISKSNSKIIWRELSTNPNSEILKYLKKNPDKINLDTIHLNKNPRINKIIELFIE